MLSHKERCHEYTACIVGQIAASTPFTLLSPSTRSVGRWLWIRMRRDFHRGHRRTVPGPLRPAACQVKAFHPFPRPLMMNTRFHPAVQELLRKELLRKQLLSPLAHRFAAARLAAAPLYLQLFLSLRFKILSLTGIPRACLVEKDVFIFYFLSVILSLIQLESFGKQVSWIYYIPLILFILFLPGNSRLNRWYPIPSHSPFWTITTISFSILNKLQPSLSPFWTITTISFSCSILNNYNHLILLLDSEQLQPSHSPAPFWTITTISFSCSILNNYKSDFVNKSENKKKIEKITWRGKSLQLVCFYIDSFRCAHFPVANMIVFTSSRS